MDKKSQLLLIVVQSTIIGLLLLYLVFSTGETGGNSVPKEERARLMAQMEVCAQRNDSLAAEIQQLRIDRAVPPFLDKQQVENLKKKGLSDPVNDIRKDLANEPELINMQAVHGGKMGFYFHEGIHILNEKWVFAWFEDGHNAGAVLLEYKINEDGNIGWQVLDETTY